MSYEREWNEVYGLDRDPVRQLLIYPMLLEAAQPLGDTTILDLGCGNGSLFNAVIHTQAKRMVGIDLSAPFLDFARTHIADHRVTFQRGDILKPLPYRSRSFDIVFSVFVLSELPDITMSLSEAARVLTVGGKLLIVSTHPTVVFASYLYEKLTGKMSKKIPNAKPYFEKFRSEYILTISKSRLPLYHHTLQDIVNAVIDAGLRIRRLSELTVNTAIISAFPSYRGNEDTPLFLAVFAELETAAISPNAS